MTLEQLIGQIERLRGMWLQPLGRARRIQVVAVDRKAQRVVLQLEGEIVHKSRPFSEFESLRIALETQPAIHVDSVLSGSGSSRNQPETILAHLPGIEYLRIDGRKHLARVSENSRAIGTTKEMDSVRAQSVAESIGSKDSLPPIAVVIVESSFTSLAGVLASKLQSSHKSVGIHLIVIGSLADGLFVASPAIGLEEGIYPIFDRSSTAKASASVEIAGNRYGLVKIQGKSCLFRSVEMQY